MDPEAVKALQALYDKKVKRSSTKRKRGQDEREDERTSESEIEQSDADSASEASEGSHESFAGFDDAVESDSPTVEVVSFDERNLTRNSDPFERQGYKAFMSSKVSKQSGTKTIAPPGRRKRKAEAGEDASDSEDDIKKDKALQRLLRDAHLLDGTTEALELQGGKARQQSVAEQLKRSGAKQVAQRKMPVGMRLGMRDAAKKKATAHEESMRENGIITAKKTHADKQAMMPRKKQKKERSLGTMAGVGRYKNGTLTISKREIDSVNGTGAKQGGKKGKKRGFRTFSNIG
ncbi:hypothetical protein BCR37DRAFT_385663 [Protomyces lactucae-debilis]|uniref:Protein FAF1 n=1 Tax=Protomyces lactucae-debilis TaxID=2754530 RepID=A0A1Y2FQA4_PROLT|nr:uncharacterized protein BCR37DRAFT_385663 [Protomyces lactucae-debilis]ORY86181.1 hypothetical protein BCR37DRAFT_385663 [Protomyces lactucae-debilis]